MVGFEIPIVDGYNASDIQIPIVTLFLFRRWPEVFKIFAVNVARSLHTNDVTDCRQKVSRRVDPSQTPKSQ